MEKLNWLMERTGEFLTRGMIPGFMFSCGISATVRAREAELAKDGGGVVWWAIISLVFLSLGSLLIRWMMPSQSRGK